MAGDGRGREARGGRAGRGSDTRGAAPVPRVAVVTDSTAGLTVAEAAGCGVLVVPLEVLLDGDRLHEGVDLDAATLAARLAAGAHSSTSQPAPQVFAEVYAAAVAGGATGIVSVHLSAELSGTVGAARLAAAGAGVPVEVVDTRQVAGALAAAVLAAADEAAVVADEVAAVVRQRSGWRGLLRRWPVAAGRADGGELGGEVAGGARAEAGDPVPDPVTAATARVAAAALRAAEGTRTWFLVDSLDHLRRGGRLSTGKAVLGTVLGLRPVLTLREGRVELAERVRTRRAARERLVELAVEEVRGRGRGRVVVLHLAEQETAEQVAGRVRARLGGQAAVTTGEVGAVVAAHAGPGVLGVVVAD